ncbi:hypothetical protein FB451DRAFT_1398570 [Mycena latifolia]|nr:hypothetical protein FB451DRAFT_1398570 [Mycena latifolia]
MVLLVQELIDTIIDEVKAAEPWWQGNDSINSCALVARIFLVPNQHRLFHSFTLQPNTVKDVSVGFTATPTSPPILGSLGGLEGVALHSAFSVEDLEIDFGDSSTNGLPVALPSILALPCVTFAATVAEARVPDSLMATISRVPTGMPGIHTLNVVLHMGLKVDSYPHYRVCSAADSVVGDPGDTEAEDPTSPNRSYPETDAALKDLARLAKPIYTFLRSHRSVNSLAACGVSCRGRTARVYRRQLA